MKYPGPFWDVRTPASLQQQNGWSNSPEGPVSRQVNQGRTAGLLQNGRAQQLRVERLELSDPGASPAGAQGTLSGLRAPPGAEAQGSRTQARTHCFTSGAALVAAAWELKTARGGSPHDFGRSCGYLRRAYLEIGPLSPELITNTEPCLQNAKGSV